MTLWQQLKMENARLQRESQKADATLETIEAYARQEGCTPDEAIVQLIKQALEIYLRKDRDHRSWEKLSAREKEVAALMCGGLTNRQIAARLVVSPETIKTHVSHLLRKFGLRSRRELRARLRGWDLDEWRGTGDEEQR
jgi:DNA-binding NarL/FixJ family response regulator